MKVLITSGGCKVPIDEVRHITNFSSGRYGIEIAQAFIRSSALGITPNKVILLREKGSRNVSESHLLDFVHPSGIPISYEYKDHNEYMWLTKKIILEHKPDIIVSAAAVSDFVLTQVITKETSYGPNDLIKKLTSDSDCISLILHKGPKVISTFKELNPASFVVGFKLLISPTNEERHKAINQVFDNGADLVVFNDLTQLRKGVATRFLCDTPYNGRQCDNANALVESIIIEYEKEKL